MKHSEIRNRLYDFAMGELNDGERSQVDEHLASCASCTDELREIQRAVTLVPQPTSLPSDTRDETFWARLSMHVEQEILKKRHRKLSTLEKLVGSARSFFAFRPSYAYAIGCLLGAIIIATFATRFLPVSETDIAGSRPTLENAATVQASDANQDRVSQYFRKSRTLLVGIANLQTDDGGNIDLRAEKNSAQWLIHEARYIKMKPLNNRTERLVGDLERILIELANLEQENDLPNVELIQSGIRQQNLLFKIRMAEASFDTSRYASAPRIY